MIARVVVKHFTDQTLGLDEVDAHLEFGDRDEKLLRLLLGAEMASDRIVHERDQTRSNDDARRRRKNGKNEG